MYMYVFLYIQHLLELCSSLLNSFLSLSLRYFCELKSIFIKHLVYLRFFSYIFFLILGHKLSFHYSEFPVVCIQYKVFRIASSQPHFW